MSHGLPDGHVLLLLVRRELLLLPGLLRCLLLSSTINAIDDTFLLAGVGISRYAPQCSGTDHCALSIAIIHFRLLHWAFSFLETVVLFNICSSHSRLMDSKILHALLRYMCICTECMRT